MLQYGVISGMLALGLALAPSAYSTDMADPIEKYRVNVFPWHKHFDIGEPKREEGPNILHNKRVGRHYTKDPEAVKFVQESLLQATPLGSDAETLRFASDSVSKDLRKEGVYIEVGFGLPRTSNLLAGLNPQTTVYSFFSPEGQEGDWEKEKGRVIEAGTLAPLNADYTLPLGCCLNLEYYKGDLTKVLTAFKRDILKDRPVACLVIDLNTCAPTSKVLSILEENMRPGSIVFYDEYYNSNSASYRENEFKAHHDFLKSTGYGHTYLGYNENHEQVVIRIEKGEKE